MYVHLFYFECWLKLIFLAVSHLHVSHWKRPRLSCDFFTHVALIASHKHLCIRIDCKSEFIPMSAFFVCDIIELPWTDLKSHIWHYNSISSCLDLRGASKLPLAGILLSQMLHWILCPSCTVFTWKDKVAAVEKLELHCQHWQIRATPWALKTYHFVLHEFIDIQSCRFT